MPQIRNIWKEYGLSGNPYHTDHLEATSEDAAFYVRRQDAEAELGTFLVSEDHGAIFVEGHVGVGKTTFVNQTQYLALQQKGAPRLLPSTSLVEIQDNTSPEGLVLSILAAVLKALRHHMQGIEDDKRFQRLEAYTKQARITSWTVGGSVAGTGATLGKGVTATEPPTITLQALQALLDDASALVADHDFDKVVVLLNNLDNVDERHAFGLLHDLRDTLLGRDGWIFVLAGPVGIRTSLANEAGHRRLSERISPSPVVLGPLPKAGVHEVIQKRVEALRLHDDVKPPVPAKVIDVLYDASGGEIRYVLNRADGIARIVARDLPVTGPIEEDVAIAALHKIVRDHIESLGLTERQEEVLAAIAKAGSVRPKDYEAIGLNSAQAFNEYLSPFFSKGLVEREQSARATVYTPRGDIVLHYAGAGR